MKHDSHTRNLLIPLIFAAVAAFSFSGCRFYDDALRELKDAEYDVFILAKLLFMDATPPTVTSIIPDSEASGVARNMTVSAIFSEDIDPETVTPENFVITRGGAAVDGTLRCVRNSVIFKPISNFEANTPYDIVVHTGLKDRAGNALEEQFNWYFTTGPLEDTTAPTVTLTSPVDQASGAPVNSGINVIFSESVDPSTVTADTFVVTRGDKTVTGQLSCMKNSVTFRPSSELAPNAAFHVKITNGVTDLAGNAMTVQYTWDFATEAARDTTLPRVEMTVPNDKAVDADTDPWINVVFSETVDPSTVTTANLYVTRDGNPVSGIVSCSNNTAVFRPKAHLDAGASYRVTVTTRVTDMVGNRMNSPHVFTFTTGTGPDTTAPRVVSTVPEKYQSRVVPATAVSVNFSEPVDPSTVNESTFTVCTCGPVSCNVCTLVNGSVNLDSSDISATFTPSTPLPINKRYSARISTAVKDRAGNLMIEDCEWQFTTDDVPHNKAARIFFHDIDMDEGQIQGTVTIEKADDESDVKEYMLYWGSDETTKIGAVLSTFAVNGLDKSYIFGQNTVPPTNAKYLLVYTKNDTGEMITPLAFRSWDVACRMVYNIQGGSYGSGLSNLTIFNSKLYFTANDGFYGNGLWVYDGENNPTMVYDIYAAYESSNPSFLTVFNNKLFFQATDGEDTKQHGAELWVYDGIHNPTMVYDINPEHDSSNPSYLTVFNNKLYFQADDSNTHDEYGVELWAYEGVGNPYLAYDINTDGHAGSYPSRLTKCNNKLYFVANNTTDQDQLWVYDGINDPYMVYDCNNNTIKGLILYNNKLYFRYYNMISPLLVYDGINSPYPSTINCNITNFEHYSVFNGKLFFQGESELASFDESTNTTNIYDINPGPYSSDRSNPDYFYVFNDKLFFQANDGDHGIELWIYDDINEPYMVADIISGKNSLRPKNFCALNNKLYFSAGLYNDELWVYFEK